MYVRKLLSICLLAVAVVITSCALPARIIMVGDSITVGVVGPSNTVSPNAYVPLLQEDLGTDWELVQEGCGGSNSKHWRPNGGNFWCGLLFSDRVVGNYPVYAIHILLGTVDALGSPLSEILTVEEYGQYVNQMINAALEGPNLNVWYVILSSPPPIHPGVNDYEERMVRLQEISTWVQARCNIPNDRVFCGPNFTNTLDPATHMGVNNIHPNEAGMAEMADQLYNTFTTLGSQP